MTRFSPSKDIRTAKADHWLKQTNFQRWPKTLSLVWLATVIGAVGANGKPTLRNIPTLRSGITSRCAFPNAHPGTSAKLPTRPLLTSMMAAARVPLAGRRPMRGPQSDPCAENSVSDAVSAISTPRQDPVTKLGSVASLEASGRQFCEQLTNACLPWIDFLPGVPPSGLRFVELSRTVPLTRQISSDDEE
jgi:hypothetical protein